MKNKIFNIIATFIAIFAISSCSDDRDPVLDQTSAKVAQFKSAPSGTYTVTENNMQNVFETFVITPPVYNINTEYVYQLQVAKAGTNFESPINLGSSTNLEYIKITYNQINAAALTLGAKNLIPFDLDVRIKSNIKNTTDYLYSSATSFTVVPFVAGPIYNYQDLYLIGDATAANWDNNASNMNMFPLLKDKSNSNVYTFTGYFKAGGFKILPTKGDWSKQYGYKSNGVLAVNDGGAGNIPIATSGYYKLTVNTGDATYSIEPYSDPTNTYSVISIIGTVNGNWDADTDFTQSADPHVWYTTATINNGEFKFRANHDWGVNWGAGQEFFGTGVNNSSNIPVAIGWKYNIYFNDITGDYSLIPVY